MRLFQAFEALNSEIQCCLLKGIENISKSFTGIKDIDLLVHRNSQLVLQKILIDHGFRQVVSGWHKTQHGTEHYVLYEEETDQFHHIHVHYCIVFGTLNDREYEFPYIEKWISTARQHPTYPIKVLPIELIMAFEMLRAIIENNHNLKTATIRIAKGKPKLYQSNFKYFNKFVYFDSKINREKLKKFIEDYFVFVQNELLEFDSLFKSKQLTPLKLIRLRLKILPKIKRFMRLNSKDAKLLRSIRKKEVSDGLAFRTVNSGGAMISIIGADGTGKSTMCKELVEWLRWGRFTAQCVYLGEPKRYFLNFLKYFIKISSVLRINYLQSTFIGLDAVVKARIRANNVKNAVHLKNKGWVVVTDRYPLKEFWDKKSMMDSPKLDTQNKFYNTVVSIFNEVPDCPDALIFLHAADDVILDRREKEVNGNKLKENLIVQKNHDVMEVAAELGYKPFDTNQKWKKLYNNVRSYVWKSI